MGDEQLDAVVVGAGPCGLAAAISLQKAGFATRLYDRDCVVSSITQYPTYATFFSTAEKLSLGGLPFVVPVAKPSRRDALAYYRAVVTHFGLDVRQYETVESIEREGDGFRIATAPRGGPPSTVRARAVVVATGYWGSPNRIGVPGEDLPHVSHAYREGHHAFQQDVVVVGGGNSSAEAALELWRAGARVTLAHFGPTFDKKIKPWILPDLENRIAEGSIGVRWNCRVTSIDRDAVHLRGGLGDEHTIPAQHVYLLTGFAPNVDLLRATGVRIDDKTGIPEHDPGTLETNVPGLFVAGVVIAGFDANKVFIENGRYHGDRIVARLRGLPPPETPGVSRDLDS
ncbi:MAG TPA: YpdA family putative bacillithiol disulfide reductase [Gemmatimonadaceae bacterium]